ncbi:MAG: hypothetical protein JWQ57_92, partial [Mucilaginibacter sp.]|nr:hypothetical protein [Mucilaginibacter sp.]
KSYDIGHLNLRHQYRRKQNYKKYKCENQYRISKGQVKLLECVAPDVIIHKFLKSEN